MHFVCLTTVYLCILSSAFAAPSYPMGPNMAATGANPEAIVDFLRASLLAHTPYSIEFGIVEEKGYGLHIDRRRSSPAVDGGPAIAAIQSTPKYVQHQNALMFALSIAHEIGHIVGEGPLEYMLHTQIPRAVNGEADYQPGRLLLIAFERNR